MTLGPVMLDLSGLELTVAEKELLRRPLAGGVILFARNFESTRQLAALTGEIRALREPHIIAITPLSSEYWRMPSRMNCGARG